MKKIIINSASLLLLLLPLLTVQAKKSDNQQEITITSARQAGDLKNKIISYLDNVSISQGSLSIKADVIQVLKPKGSDQPLYIAKGKPAVFKQLLEDESPIVLEANEIRYDPLKSTITISGNAVLKQEGSEVRGSKITYNTLTEQLTAESDSNNNVTTVLSPKIKKNN